MEDYASMEAFIASKPGVTWEATPDQRYFLSMEYGGKHCGEREVRKLASASLGRCRNISEDFPFLIEMVLLVARKLQVTH